MAEWLLCREIGLLAALSLTLSEEKIMLKRYLSLVMVGLLFHAVGAGPASASPQADKQDQLTAKVKADVAKRGVGEKAGVTVKLRDKTEVKGYVSQAGEDNFVVRNPKTSSDTTVAYRDVTAMKGKGLSKGAKIGIAVGIAVAAVAISAVIALRNCCGITFKK